MKLKLLPILFCLTTFTLFSLNATATTQEESNQLKLMSMQAAKLQAELDKLQQEIESLKQPTKKSTKKAKKQQQATYYQAPRTSTVTTSPQVVAVNKPAAEQHYETEKNYRLVVQQHPTPVKGQVENIYYPHTVFRYGGISVITSPYIGTRSEFDGSDLIVNISSINEDLRLLEQVDVIKQVLRDHGAPPLTHPLVELSGKIEALTYVNKPFVGATVADVDLGSLELTTTAILNEWALGFMAFDFDGTPPVISGKRVNNSRLYLNKGFLTLGNLNAYPLYSTWGQYYVPFGRYSSNMLSGPLTMSLARTKSRAILLGYKQPGASGVFASAYIFDGDAHPDHSGWNGGVNLGYAFVTQSVKGEAAFGIIADLADSDGMQSTGGSEFSGFSGNLQGGSESLDKRVPAADFNLKFGYGKWSFITEYATAVTHFNPNDLQFNGSGALPSALNLEAAYGFTAIRFPMNIAVGYGFTTQAFAVNLARHRVIGAINASFIRDTIVTFELRHDWAYPEGTTGAGRTSSTTTSPVDTASTGQELTIATLQVGLYF